MRPLDRSHGGILVFAAFELGIAEIVEDRRRFGEQFIGFLQGLQTGRPDVGLFLSAAQRKPVICHQRIGSLQLVA